MLTHVQNKIISGSSFRCMDEGKIGSDSDSFLFCSAINVDGELAVRVKDAFL